MHVMLDARYLREKPSGIGSYVQALVERVPALAPDDRFKLWAHLRAALPLSPAENVSEIVVKSGPNSPWSALWPKRDASFAGVDVFHSPHNLLPRGIPCASVVTVHDVMALEIPRLHVRGLERLSKSYYYPQAIWRALRKATHLIAPSRATADRISALHPAAAPRLTIIPEAADPVFRPSENHAAAQVHASCLSGGDAPFLLVVGANTPSKRHDVALAAFAEAVPAPWRLVFVQRRKARARPAERVIWLEAMSREEIVVLMQTAGALIQPSLYEGFGLPVLEAMACGCAVVASDIPPFREITAGNALLFPPNDFEKLTGALREVTTSSSLRESLGKEGAERAKNFPWDRCAAETLEVYRAAAAATRQEEVPRMERDGVSTFRRK